ncbi:hypothetical protein N0V90_012539 [Kalmusia sp. IMI 367209]|nr:hypothetical protein N0V90_012539 [Kalmusia sp. IMI 367209]
MYSIFQVLLLHHGQPRGIFDYVEDFFRLTLPIEESVPIGHTLLSILLDYTLVHMWVLVSDEVEDALRSQTCSAGKRNTFTRHASRQGITSLRIEKRAPSDSCLHSTVAILLRDTGVVTAFLSLYRGNPIPGTLSKVSQLPAFASTLMTDTFINGLTAAANFLTAVAPGMSNEEIIYLYYAMFDTASQFLSYRPDNFEEFAIARDGNMPNHFPNVEDTDCEAKLCDSTDGSTCSSISFLSG